MPVRIMCSISFSADDEPGRLDKDMFDDRYRKAIKSSGDDSREDQADGCDELDVYDEDDTSELDSLAAFFDGCSLHGANHIFSDEKKFSVRQGFWAVVFLLALSAFLLQVYDRIIYYLTYDHVTLLDERNAPNITFPAITFCNYNYFRRSQISYSDLLFMGQLLGFEEDMAPGFPVAPEPNRPGSRFSLDEFHNRTKHRIEDMLLECKFSGKDCGADSFQEVQ